MVVGLYGICSRVRISLVRLIVTARTSYYRPVSHTNEPCAHLFLSSLATFAPLESVPRAKWQPVMRPVYRAYCLSCLLLHPVLLCFLSSVCMLYVYGCFGEINYEWMNKSRKTRENDGLVNNVSEHTQRAGRMRLIFQRWFASDEKIRSCAII